jgi:hypothetical protein
VHVPVATATPFAATPAQRTIRGFLELGVPGGRIRRRDWDLAIASSQVCLFSAFITSTVIAVIAVWSPMLSD